MSAFVSCLHTPLWLVIVLWALAAAAFPGVQSAVASRQSQYEYEPRLADYEALRSCLLSWAIPRFRILSRDDPLDSARYAALNWQWNSLNGTLAPLVYVEAASDQDVSAAVRCGVALNVRVVAKGGAHSYLKLGFGDSASLVVDLQLLNSVELDEQEETVVIGAGTRQGKILAELWTAGGGGWLLPVGNCPTVGFAGYVLGGGYGFYSRWLGLGTDHLLELSMVDATGTLLTVNNVTDPELFWALRGGGGGNFGIVTRMKLRLRRAPSHVLESEVEYSWNQFPDWLRAWQIWFRSEPPSHLSAISRFYASGFRTRFLSMGGNAAELVGVISSDFPPPENVASFLQLAFHDFVVYRAQSYWPADELEPLTHISQLVNLSRHNAPGWKRVKSFFVDQDVDVDMETEDGVQQLHTLLYDYAQHSEALFEHQGGAIAGVGPSDTAYVHRGRALFGVQLQAFAPNSGQEPVAAVAAMERFFEESRAPSLWNHTSSYQNYLDSSLSDYLRRYYGANLERLVAVKARIDPNNVFHHQKSIPTSLV